MDLIAADQEPTHGTELFTIAGDAVAFCCNGWDIPRTFSHKEVMNNEAQGWIKIHRQILNHWVCKKPEYLAAWIKILLTVQFSDQICKTVIKGSVIECERGQSIKSIDSWIEVLGSRYWTYKKVRTFFELLEREAMINRIDVGFKTTKLSVCNYDTYQTTGQVEGKHRASTGQAQGNSIRKKEGKNERIEDVYAPAKADGIKKRFRKPEISELREYVVSIGLPPSEAERIHDFYEAKGWVIGNHPMKDWKATTRNWARNSKSKNLPRQDEDPMAGLRACN